MYIASKSPSAAKLVAKPSTGDPGRLVLPGDVISIDDGQESVVIKLGPGLHRVDQETLVTKPGLLHQVGGSTSKYWVNGSQRRVR